MTEQSVPYTLQFGDKLVIVEHVPARVCTQCGERLYAPETVERLQKTVWGQKKPSRVVETQVYDFAVQG